jgi:hypothetical protein
MTLRTNGERGDQCSFIDHLRRDSARPLSGAPIARKRLQLALRTAAQTSYATFTQSGPHLGDER